MHSFAASSQGIGGGKKVEKKEDEKQATVCFECNNMFVKNIGLNQCLSQVKKGHVRDKKAACSWNSSQHNLSFSQVRLRPGQN